MDACPNSAELAAHLAGELPADEGARLDAHLAECARCQAVAAGFQQDGRLAQDLQQAYQAPAVTRSMGPSSPIEQPDTGTLEGYEIIHEIHRGGQGVVYKAIQIATKRPVALKVLLGGRFASPRQRRRFEREVDLAATLQHPNIVTIYDSGVTEDRQFFAMEYVRGRPLDAYLRDKQWPVEATLRLFQRICAAVNYAHQRGIIHRDLKPANILVDADGEPHILDFGLAKAAGSDLQDGAPVSLTGEFMGTLAYASPEQTKGDPNLIDIRTDVYSLGVVLYEMLTGKYPYPVVGQMAEVLQNIADAEPRRPSTIRRQINDEVETIVLKSLAKERGRRYQSAEALAQDVERYLAGEPIDAKRDSGWYVLRKSLRRYRVPVAAAFAFVMLLAGSLVTVSYSLADARAARQSAEKAAAAEAAQARAADQARQEAVLAQQEEGRQRQVAEQATVQAERSRDQAVRIQRSLENMLASAQPGALGHDVTVREVMDQAMKTVPEDLQDEPRALADVLTTIGRTYRSLGFAKQAQRAFESALELRRQEFGDRSLEVAETLMDLTGALRGSRGTQEQALACTREALEIRRSLLGDDHRLTLHSRSVESELMGLRGQIEEALANQLPLFGWLINCCVEPESFPEDVAQAIRRFRTKWAAGDQDGAQAALADAVRLYVFRIRNLWANGDHEGARTLIRNVYTPLLGPTVDAALIADWGLGSVFWLWEQYQDPDLVEPLIREMLYLLRNSDTPKYTSCAWALSLLGQVQMMRGDHAAAEQAYAEMVDLRRDEQGSDSPAYVYDALRLHDCLLQQHKSEEARKLRRALGESVALLAKQVNPDAATALVRLGRRFHDSHEPEAAADAYRGALAMWHELPADTHPELAEDLLQLANDLAEQGELEIAESLARGALVVRRASLGTEHPAVAELLLRLSYFLQQQEQYQEAATFAREAVDLSEAAHGAHHAATAKSWWTLGWVFLHAEEFAESERAMRKALSIWRGLIMEQPDDRGLRSSLATGLMYVAYALQPQQREREAMTFLLEALAIRGESGRSLHDWLDCLQRTACTYARLGQSTDADALVDLAMHRFQNDLLDQLAWDKSAERDLNRNGVPDLQDIARGISADRNDNDVPDQCELRLYVTTQATGNATGLSWAEAYPNLTVALAHAAASGGQVTEIWVAQGSYAPAGPGGDRRSTFRLVPGVAVYGGFAGGETSIDQRRLDVNVTTLTGDLNGDDATASVNRSDNCFQVLVASGTDASTVLDGFRISGGTADGTASDLQHAGGGLMVAGGSPVIRNCTFADNTASWSGGGLAILAGARPQISACRFLNNRGGWRGGGAAGVHLSSPVFDDCLFQNNTSPEDGGGVSAYHYAHPTVRHCRFIGNRAGAPPQTGSGGGLQAHDHCTLAIENCSFVENAACWGGALSLGRVSNGTLDRCAFRRNSAWRGGGGIQNHGSHLRAANCLFVANEAGATSGGGLQTLHGDNTAWLTNCTFFANSAAQTGGAIAALYGSSATIANCILWAENDGDGSNGTTPIQVDTDSTANVTHCCIQYHSDEGPDNGNFRHDPSFVDPNGADGILGTVDDDFCPAPESPCIDTGDNDSFLDVVAGWRSPPFHDARGRPRFANGDLSKATDSAPRIDVGAIEFDAATDP